MAEAADQTTQEQLDAMLSEADRNADGEAGVPPADADAASAGGVPSGDDPSTRNDADQSDAFDVEGGSFQSVEEIGADREPDPEPAHEAAQDGDVLADQVQQMLDEAVAEQQGRGDAGATVDPEASDSAIDGGSPSAASTADETADPEADELSDEAALIAQIDQMLAEGGDPPPAGARPGLADDRGMQDPTDLPPAATHRPAPAEPTEEPDDSWTALTDRPDDKATADDEPAGFDFATAIESAGRADDRDPTADADPDDEESAEPPPADAEPGSAEAIADELDADAARPAEPSDNTAPVAGDMASMDDLLAASAEERLDAEEEELHAWSSGGEAPPDETASTATPGEPAAPPDTATPPEPAKPAAQTPSDNDANSQPDLEPGPSLGERLYRLCARINQPLSNVPTLWRDAIGCIGLSFILCAAVLMIGAMLGAVIALALFVPLVSAYTAVVYLLMVRRSRSKPTSESDST